MSKNSTMDAIRKALGLKKKNGMIMNEKDEFKIIPRNNLKKNLPALIVFGVAIAYFGLCAAPVAKRSLFDCFIYITKVNFNPMSIRFVPWTGTVVGSFLIVYALAAAIWITSLKHFRPGEEKGSAKWGDVNYLHSLYWRDWKIKRTDAETGKTETVTIGPKIFSKNVGMGYDGWKTQRNTNTVVIGGSGSGKTRYYAKPNLLQGNTSFVVLDPKGEICEDTGEAMKAMGYKIKVLNLKELDQSDFYNPFEYIRTDDDILRMSTMLFQATSEGADGKAATGGAQDPFWDRAAQALLIALCFLIKYYAPKNEQNIGMISDLLKAAALDEGQDATVLDILISQVADINSLAYKFYQDYRGGGTKTLQSINITLSARLMKFNLTSVRNMMKFDMMNLRSLGEEKTVLYAVIPDQDKSFNFIVSILYLQLFQELYYSADVTHKKDHKRLPIPVHFLMDEFNNVSLPSNFEELLSTMRSRGISVSIILQNKSQLEGKYKDQWKSIIGNCDETVFLGANEEDTFEYISKRLGKETIDINQHSVSKGMHGSFSTTSQLDQRDLASPEEVARLGTVGCIVFIRGAHPVKDDKYELTEHPNVGLSADGNKGVPIYTHNAPPDLGKLEIYDVPGIDTGVPDIPLEFYTAEDLFIKFDNL